MILDVSYQYRHYIQPYLRDPKKKAYSLLGMTLIATVVFGGFAIRPAIVTVVGLRKEVTDLRHTDRLLNEKISALASAQTHYKISKEDLYLLDLALPSSPEIPELIETLSTCAGKAQVSLLALDFKKPNTSTSSIQKAEASLKSRGDYLKTMKFISLIENNIRQMKIVALNLNHQGDVSQGNLEVQIVFEYYYLDSQK